MFGKKVRLLRPEKARQKIKESTKGNVQKVILHYVNTGDIRVVIHKGKVGVLLSEDIKEQLEINV